MKQRLFYLFILLQATLLIALAGQYYFINTFGMPFKIYLKDNTEYQFGHYNSDVYIEYEISELTKTKWKMEEAPSYRQALYVMLELNSEGVFEVAELSPKKLRAQQSDQLVLRARYVYDFEDQIYLDYDLPLEIEQDYFVDINRNEPIIAVFKQAPWGQIRLEGLENSP